MFLSEKIIKPLIGYQPFIVLGPYQYLKELNENMLTKYVGYNDNELPHDLTVLQEFLTNPNNNLIFSKAGFRDVKIKYARKNSDYSEWFDVVCGSDSLNDVFLGVDFFVYLHPVDDISVAPVGVPGDLINTTGMTASEYYWSPITNDWVEIGFECVVFIWSPVLKKSVVRN